MGIHPYALSELLSGALGAHPITHERRLNIVRCQNPMKEEEFKARLNALKKELDRNEELMQEAAISYEDLVAEKESLLSTMEKLRQSRATEIRQRELSSH